MAGEIIALHIRPYVKRANKNLERKKKYTAGDKLPYGIFWTFLDELHFPEEKRPFKFFRILKPSKTIWHNKQEIKKNTLYSQKPNIVRNTYKVFFFGKGLIESNLRGNQ